MFSKPLNKSEVKKILLISLTNIGDVILTFPVFDILKENFPQAAVAFMAGPKVVSLLEHNPNIYKFYVYDKRQPKNKTVELIKELRRQEFDLVIDLRNSLFPWLIGAKHKSTFLDFKKSYWHMKIKHVKRLQSVLKGYLPAQKRYAVVINEDVRRTVGDILRNHLKKNNYIVFIPGAADSKKRWSKENFIELHRKIQKKYDVDIVYVGDERDREVVGEIQKILKDKFINLAGKLNLLQLAEVLKNSKMVICNDSGPMHLACYFDKPVLAIFGPTDPVKYSPWSENSACVYKPQGDKYERIKNITADDVMGTFEITGDDVCFSKTAVKNNFKNILIVRTDRIGDVVVTAPALKAVRKHYPNARITLLLNSSTESLMKNNPYIDRIIIDKKDKEHKGRMGFLKLILFVKKEKFDLAVVFHTKDRTNMLCAFAGIKNRIGYDNDKMSWLLTDRIPDSRHLGLKHEAQYCLDVLNIIGIYEKDLGLSVSVSQEALQWAERVLQQKSIGEKQVLVIFHLGASDPAKRWPAYRFAELAQEIHKKYEATIIMIGAPDIRLFVDQFLKLTSVPVLDLVGRTNLSQLTGIIKYSKLVVSNDSGPVHIAAALGIPVVSIFTRNQPGINPERWRPLGSKSAFVAVEKDHPLQKNLSFSQAGDIDSKYLEIIQVSQVLEAVDAVFKVC